MTGFTDNCSVLKKYLATYTSERWSKECAYALENNLELDNEISNVKISYNFLVSYISNYIPGKKENFNKEQALEGLLLCVKFDRDYTLHFIKIDDNDIGCANGVPWVLEKNLTDVTLVFRGKPMKSTISKNYEIYANAHNAGEDYMEQLNELLKTTLPHWAIDYEDYEEEESNIV